MQSADCEVCTFMAVFDVFAFGSLLAAFGRADGQADERAGGRENTQAGGRADFLFNGPSILTVVLSTVVGCIERSGAQAGIIAEQSAVECTNYEEKGGTVPDFFVALQMHSAKRVCLFWRVSPSPEGPERTQIRTFVTIVTFLGLEIINSNKDNVLIVNI